MIIPENNNNNQEQQHLQGEEVGVTRYILEIRENGELIVKDKNGIVSQTTNIKGPEGSPGTIGPQGPIGNSGKDGLTWAPRISEDGFSIFFENELGERTSSYPIKGRDGERGIQGPAGPKGQDADVWHPVISIDGRFLLFENQRGERTEEYLIQGEKGDKGEIGATGPIGPIGPVFIPSVNAEGEISWSNNGNLPNPTPINIRGSKGDSGENGVIFHPVIIDGYLTWTNDKGLPNPDPVKITGPQGVTGEKGRDGRSAYQVWLDNGNLGSEVDFLQSLKGEKGEAAEHISTGYQDVTDYKCPVQLIDTDLIINSNNPSENPEDIIDERINKIKKLREEGHKSVNQEQYRVGWFKKFMWWCAGADRDLLTMCPGDHSKYVGVGTVIFFTALMAWFSSFIAIQLVFDPVDISGFKIPLPAICFSTFWAAMIFFLDRFITNTMYSDGKVTISKEEFFSGLPRITIAIFLGIIISAPLELKIFNDAIEAKIEHDQRFAGLEDKKKVGELIDIEYSNIQRKYQNEISQNEAIIKSHQASLDNLNKQRADLYKEGSWTDDFGKEHTYQTKKSKDEQAEWDNNNKSKVDALNAQILELSSKNVELVTQQNNEISTQTQKEENYKERIDSASLDNGLLVRLSKLHDLAMDGYKPFNEERSNSWIDYITLHPLWYYLFFSPIGLIMLLFILIDISPVLYKMMLADGNYDNYMHQEKLLAQDKIRLSLSKMLKKLDDSELKRVAPFIMGDIYEKMAGDSYIFKTEAEFRAEMANYQHKARWWSLWPLSWIRWIFWKEESIPTAPVIILDKKTPTEQEERINTVNEEVFEEVLDMKRRIILASYRRWYKRQHDNIIGDRVDDENAGRPPFDN